MGINCSQTQNSMVIVQTLHSFDEKEQQKHQAQQTLKYSFPQKQILEINKTKLQLHQEQDYPRLPKDPGSPMQALSEQSLQVCEQTQFNHSCPTTTRINRHYPNEFSLQHNNTLSMKDFKLNSIILKKQTFLLQHQIIHIIKNIKGQQKKVYQIIRTFYLKQKIKYRYNSDSQSPSSTQTIKSVRFLVTEQVKVQKKYIRTKSLSRKQSSKRQNQSTIYSNFNQSLYYKIEM